MRVINQPTYHASAQETANGNTPDLFWPPQSERVRLLISVTAINAATTGIVKVMAKTNAGTYIQVYSTGNITAVGVFTQEFTSISRIFRIEWTLSGATKEMTFEIDVVYAENG